ncbi:SDR family oxidoreductase [Zhihengliuella sp.]|uniref:SDR family oxidoreductase n=1 Tax=Zhihengliuella sp. TaxID=1954483 RepID=UPI0028128E04|nr:SDR family oxidoreductase [Zhihengliuella sp.]
MNLQETFGLAGRVAVVTGATRGLGAAFVQALADAGADVVIAARSVDEGAAVAHPAADGHGTAAAVADLESRGVRARAYRVDVTRRDDVERLLADVVHDFGRVDILVNNAGTCIHKPALEVTDEEWDSVLEVNLDALWKCSQVFGRHFVEQRAGSIVNIGSISAQIVNRPQWQPAYNASKAAVHQLTKSLAAEWAPYNVRVNALAPGYVGTDMAPVDDPRFKPRWIDDAPMQRAATPEEIAPSVVYLASDASSFTTGTVLVADGGYTLF